MVSLFAKIFLFFVLSFAPCFLSSLQASISHFELKSVHSVVSPEFESFSVIHGLRLLETHEIENRRFYGNYGVQSLGKFCGSIPVAQVREELAQNQDCPLDSMSNWIQRLFPSEDGANFVANSLESDLLSYLNSETIGKILGRLSLEKKGIQSEAQLIDDLELLFTQVKPATLPSSLGSSIDSLENFRGQARGLAQLLVQAFQEDGKNTYPPDLAEHALLAWMWRKGESKSDLLNYFKGLHQTHAALVPDARILVDHSEAQKAFLDARYEENDFDLDRFRYTDEELAFELPQDPEKIPYLKNPQAVARQFLEDPEKMAFVIAQDQFQDPTLPPLIPCATSRIPDSGGAYYSDCAETALRNLLNVVLYDRDLREFDVDFLDDLEAENQLSIHPSLRAFYENHPDPAESLSQRVRDEWSETVVSHLEGVEYLKAGPSGELQYQMAPGIDTMIQALTHLLFFEESENPLSQAESRKSKIQALGPLLSRAELQLTLRSRGSSVNRDEIANEGESLEVVIGNQVLYFWKFLRHSVAWVSEFGQPCGWRLDASLHLLNLLKNDHKQRSPFILSWFSDPLRFHQMKEVLEMKGHGSWVESLIYARSLSFTGEKIQAIDHLYELKPIENRFAKKLFSKIPYLFSYYYPKAYGAMLRHPLPVEEVPLETFEQREQALFVAAETDRLDVIQAILTLEPEILSKARRFGGGTIAQAAAASGKLTILKYLAAVAPELLTVKGQFGKTPLQSAVENGHLEVVKYFTEQDPEILKGQTAQVDSLLRSALSFEQVGVLEYFLEQCPSMIRSVGGAMTHPLAHLASQMGKVKVLEFLAQKFPETLTQRNLYGETPIQLAIASGELESVEFIGTRFPAVLTEPDRSGRLLAQWASEKGYFNGLRGLAEKFPQVMNEKVIQLAEKKECPRKILNFLQDLLMQSNLKDLGTQDRV